jgi:hypothetical protein
MYDLLVESYSKARKDFPHAVQHTDFAESDYEPQLMKAGISKSVGRISRLKRKLSTEESGKDSGHDLSLL